MKKEKNKRQICGCRYENLGKSPHSLAGPCAGVVPCAVTAGGTARRDRVPSARPGPSGGTRGVRRAALRSSRAGKGARGSGGARPYLLRSAAVPAAGLPGKWSFAGAGGKMAAGSCGREGGRYRLGFVPVSVSSPCCVSLRV